MRSATWARRGWRPGTSRPLGPGRASGADDRGHVPDDQAPQRLLTLRVEELEVALPGIGQEQELVPIPQGVRQFDFPRVAYGVDLVLDDRHRVPRDDDD